MTDFEFSRPIEIARLPAGDAVYRLTASPDERKALALRFGILALDRLEAEVALTRVSGGFIRLAATLVADVIQECVVTLDPFAAHVEDKFSLLFGEEVEEEPQLLMPDTELIEPLQDGRIDIGEAVAQQLSLALDPYPRSPAAEAALAAESAESGSPFAELAKIREKK